MQEKDSARNFDRKILLKFARISDDSCNKEDKGRDGDWKEEKSKLRSEGIILNENKQNLTKIRRGQSLKSL